MSTQAEGVVPVLTLGQRLNVAMENAGLKPESLAPQMRCSATTVRNYLSGRTRIDYANLVLWSQITGVRLDWLEAGQAGPDNGPGLSLLPHLDSNQKPFDYHLAA